MKRAQPIVALVLCALLGSGELRAGTPETEQQARRSFERAEAHFKAGLFAEALAEYQDGYDHLPLPGFLINIAQCQRRLGNLPQARATYRKFIMVAPDSPYVPEVQALVAELDSLVEADGQAAAAEANQASSDRERASSLPAAAGPGVAQIAEGPSKNALVAAPPVGEPAHTGTRWWLWGTIGAVALAAAATTVYLLGPAGTTTIHDGSLGTLRR